MGKTITTNGKAAFYASVYPELKQICIGMGWACGIHGSVASDMDLMLQPYEDDAVPIKKLLRGVRLFLGLGDIPIIFAGRSHHNRCMFGISVTPDMYLDISVIDDGSIGMDEIDGQIIQ